jgi:hypothetical protein
MAAQKREVYLAYTRNSRITSPQLIAVYAKSSRQQAYNWLAELAERCGGNAAHSTGAKYPTPGQGNVVAEVINPANGQRWWYELHEVV